jgi:hypothetical protein
MMSSTNGASILACRLRIGMLGMAMAGQLTPDRWCGDNARDTRSGTGFRQAPGSRSLCYTC